MSFDCGFQEEGFLTLFEFDHRLQLLNDAFDNKLKELVGKWCLSIEEKTHTFEVFGSIWLVLIAWIGSENVAEFLDGKTGSERLVEAGEEYHLLPQELSGIDAHFFLLKKFEEFQHDQDESILVQRLLTLFILRSIEFFSGKFDDTD